MDTCSTPGSECSWSVRRNSYNKAREVLFWKQNWAKKNEPFLMWLQELWNLRPYDFCLFPRLWNLAEPVNYHVCQIEESPLLLFLRGWTSLAVQQDTTVEKKRHENGPFKSFRSYNGIRLTAILRNRKKCVDEHNMVYVYRAYTCCQILQRTN